MTTLEASPVEERLRLKLSLCGTVQGVGFRPFVYRLANELGLTGWVQNSPQGVLIEVEGMRSKLESFQSRLAAERPPQCFIQGCEATWLDPFGHNGFLIRDSKTGGAKSALVLPDIATCPDCLREINDPTNRRFRYPFTNCTHCGPRFTIIEALPYDRGNTSMRGFQMCLACQAEHDDPKDRRFHAQPNACPACGPRLELWPGDATLSADRSLRPLAQANDALLAAAHVIRCGQIVAVKGIGGFHLLADARNADAVQRLRTRKHREEKPFALMFPNLASVQEICEVSPLEEHLLCSPEAPIVLLRKRSVGGMESWSAPESALPVPRTPARHHAITPAVAPNNPYLGVMLPSNPLHHLLLGELAFPVVATSGNLSDEPICTDEFDAVERLRGIADVFLVHNRPIVRHVDDSIVRVMAGRETMLRRARGFAPLPLQTRNTERENRNILAVGAQLKNSVALAIGGRVFASQHIGDLETEPANHAFRQVIRDLRALYEAAPNVIVSDLHPDYLSTKHAEDLAAGSDDSLPVSGGDQKTARPVLLHVQHHIAHVLSCVAENEVSLPALGVAWDGTGLGTDGTIWGGEFFLIQDQHVERIAHLRQFRLPGGDLAIKEPRRSALGLLHGLAQPGDDSPAEARDLVAGQFNPATLATLQTMLARGLNAPVTSSIGRLFDAIAALLGLRSMARFEGQAAMELEFAADGILSAEHYPIPFTASQTPLVLDWAPMVRAILADLASGLPVGLISAKFHNTLAEAVVAVASQAEQKRIVLSGGCFQNRVLLERTVERLRTAGFQPYWHQRVPTNDGGIALGQIMAARLFSHATDAPSATPVTPVEALRPVRSLCEA